MECTLIMKLIFKLKLMIMSVATFEQGSQIEQNLGPSPLVISHMIPNCNIYIKFY